MTTPIARMSAMKFDNKDLPLRFYYCGDVFREQPLHKGRLRQINQAGIELIGDSSIIADSETIRILAESLGILGRNYKIVLGDVSLYKYLLSQIELDSFKIEAIHSAFDKKDIASLKEILKNTAGDKTCKDLLLNLPGFAGSYGDIRKELIKSFGKFSSMTKKLFQVIELLNEETGSNVIVDLGLIKDFSYYTSLTIEGYIDGIGYPAANGGRYDELFKSFGKDFPAVGFAIDLSNLL